MSTDQSPEQGEGYASAVRNSLGRAGLTPADVDVVFAEGCGTINCDRTEAQALAAVFGKHGVSVTVPKSMYGHLYGASAATELACGLLAMREGIIPPTIGVERTATECPVSLVTQPQSRRIRNFLVNSRSREGVNVSLAISSFQEHHGRDLAQ